MKNFYIIPESEDKPITIIPSEAKFSTSMLPNSYYASMTISEVKEAFKSAVKTNDTKAAEQWLDLINAIEKGASKNETI